MQAMKAIFLGLSALAMVVLVELRPAPDARPDPNPSASEVDAAIGHAREEANLPPLKA